MAAFAYRAKSGPARSEEGVLEADTRAAALEKLSRRGLVPVRLEEKMETSSGGWLSFGVPVGESSLFTRQLADLLDAGVPLLKALRLAREQAAHPRMAEVAAAIAARVEGGKSLSEALADHPRVFSPLHAPLARAGESAGELAAALERLSDISEREQEFKARARAAMVYPLFVGGVGLLTVVFLMVFVVPRLAGLFSEMGQALPAVTRLLLAASAFLTGPGLWLLPVAVPAVFLAIRETARRPGARRAMDRAALSLPVLGEALRKSAVARFARTLSTLLGGGVPVLEALRTAADAAGSPTFRDRILSASALVREGAGLAESLGRVPGIPPYVRQMIAVGEESNTLEKALGKVADAYERQAERAMKAATSLLEPIMILTVGGVVGLIVAALLLPIFQIPTLMR